MSDETRSKVRELLVSRRHQDLVGLAEDETFDAKMPPGYDLSTAAGQFQLAKDVSSFANSSGGIIVIGLATTRTEGDPLERVSNLALVPSAAFLQSQVVGLVGTHVLPRIEGLEAQWHESATGGLGVFAIDIPAQRAETKPFIIKKVVDEGQELRQFVFGYAIRTGADSRPFTAVDLQHALAQGLSPLRQHLSRIEGKIDALGEDSRHHASAEEQEELLKVRIQDILEDDS